MAVNHPNRSQKHPTPRQVLCQADADRILFLMDLCEVGMHDEKRSVWRKMEKMSKSPTGEKSPVDRNYCAREEP